ncbi:GGDEF domain-containing protein [Azospirillum fermentarium]|uniref:hypothetical protein n=1 Tax=Azospirillum fermentarium TaxID=1233114 RepID=UPI002226FE13|nr:hypothetical protein [Azospirillum fermentarium]MCW2247690.1 GGDEF domain-containing protein [Azospirillum fermentarium]
MPDATPAREAHRTMATDTNLPASFLINDDFRRKARQILTTHSTVPAGCVHLLGLEEIRERAGRKWDIIEQRVHDVTERILQKNLSPADAWIRYGGETYLVVFASKDKSKAQITCGRIKTQLMELLLGHQDTHDITVQTVVVDMNGQMLLESHALGSLLDGLAAKAGGHDARDGVFGDGAGGDAGVMVPAPDPGVLDFVHHPIWDAMAHVTSTYACQPRLTRTGFAPLIGYAVLDDREDVNAILDLDRHTLLEAVATLTELFQNRFRYILVLPVHFETMANTKRRRDYLTTCRMISKYLAPFVSFGLVGLPRGIPMGRLNEIVTALHAVGRSVTARTEEDGADLATYAQCGIKAAGIELSPYAEGTKAALELEHFSAACHKVGLSAHVDGVRDRRTMDLAVKAGFKYLSGPIIGSDDPYPQHMVRCTEKDLLMRARPKHRPGSV